MPIILTKQDIAQRFTQWFAVMRKNQVGISNDVDSEYLHDYRVALRKTRSLLSQLKPALDETVAQHFQQEFAWLADITSPLRDLDVYLQMLPDYQRRLPRKLRAELQVFEHYLHEQRAPALTLLQSHYASERYQQLQQAWPEFLQQLETQQDFTDLSPLLQQQLEKRYRRFLAAVKNLQRRSSATEFHQFRIVAKKLRYALEFISTSEVTKSISTLMSKLKKLQDKLGEMHDLDTMLKVIERYQSELVEEGDGDVFLWQALSRLRYALATRYHQQQKSVLKALRKMSNKQQQNKFARFCSLLVIQ